jgi:tetratricopeptide (TPR) repeat protein
MVEEAISFWTEIQRYEDMLAADPQSYCFAPLSELYRKLGLLDDAIYVAKKGCDLHPDYPGAFFALGAAYVDKGLKQEARAALERTLVLNPDNFRAQKLLGQLYVEVGEIAQARKALEQVLRQNPDDTESALLLHSIASSTAGAPSDREIVEDEAIFEDEEVVEDEEIFEDEEILEEAEVIEDLTELFEEQAEPEHQVEVKVEKPEWPESPMAPETPETPETSGAPESTESTLFPEFLDAPEVPEFTEAPEVPFFADFLDTPETPEFTSFLDTPEAPEFTGFLETPVVPEPAAQHLSRDPLTTATLAELYVSQGFLDKAIAIYQELLSADPGHHAYLLRSAELKAERQRQKDAELGPAPATLTKPPAAQVAKAQQAQEEAAVHGSTEAELSRWLENIRRRRDGI